MKPLVSVIVTTKNSEKTILSCLRAIHNQSYAHLECIVVDNHSQDKTVEIVKSQGTSVYSLGPERSAQRNFGAAKAKGVFILFVDSDMVLSRTVIEDCVSTIISKKLDALYIPELIAGNSIWSSIRTFERSFYNGTVIDAVRFIKKRLFYEVHGFDKTLTGPEDWDLDKKVRARGKTGIITAPLYHHEDGISLGSYIRKKMYYAEDFERYIEKWGREDPDIRKQFGWYYRFVGVFIENGKWKNLLKKPHLAVLMYILRFYLGFRYFLYTIFK